MVAPVLILGLSGFFVGIGKVITTALSMRRAEHPKDEGPQPTAAGEFGVAP